MNIYQIQEYVTQYIEKLSKQPTLDQHHFNEVKTLLQDIVVLIDLFEKLQLGMIIPGTAKKETLSLESFHSTLSECYTQSLKIRQKIHLIPEPSKLSLFFKKLWYFDYALYLYNPSVTESFDAVVNKLFFCNRYWDITAKNHQSLLEKNKNNVLFYMRQGLIPGLGKSQGECYGFALSYAANRREKTTHPLSFNQKTTAIQNNQFTPDVVEGFYRKRLGRRHYQPNALKQAQGIAQYARQHPNEHLMLSLEKNNGGHAVYLQLLENKWHYFDSNIGAFEFNREEDFIEFYQDLYFRTNEASALKWHSYEVFHLTEKKPDQTYESALNAFLTGPRYQAGYAAQEKLRRALALLFAVVIVGIILYFAPITIPIIFGAIAAAATTYIIGRLIGAQMIISRFQGLLAIPEWLHYQAYGQYHTTSPTLTAPSSVMETTTQNESTIQNNIHNNNSTEEILSTLYTQRKGNESYRALLGYQHPVDDLAYIMGMKDSITRNVYRQRCIAALPQFCKKFDTSGRSIRLGPFLQSLDPEQYTEVLRSIQRYLPKDAKNIARLLHHTLCDGDTAQKEALCQALFEQRPIESLRDLRKILMNIDRAWCDTLLLSLKDDALKKLIKTNKDCSSLNPYLTPFMQSKIEGFIERKEPGLTKASINHIKALSNEHDTPSISSDTSKSVSRLD